MRFLLVWVLLCALTSCCLAADKIDVDKMDYADKNAAQAAWLPMRSAEGVQIAPEKTPDGRQAVAFPTDMAQIVERAYWDKGLNLDLTTHGGISFWVKAEGDMTAISHVSLYFESGDGWYSTHISPEASVWQKITLDRSSFRTEDTPGGWGNLKKMRVSLWKSAPKKVALYIGPIEAYTSKIVVVRNSRARGEADTWVEKTAGALKSAGLESVTLEDLDVERGALKGKKIAIYPYNPQISDAESDAVKEFVDSGGKLIVFYLLQQPFAQMLGLKDTRHTIQQYDGQFSQMRRAKTAPVVEIAGLPERLMQSSWNIISVKPASSETRVLANWFDASGKDTGEPAVLMNDAGVFVSHVLLDDDISGWNQMLRALLGHYEPSLWQDATVSAEHIVGQMIPPYSSFNQAVQAIEAGVSSKNNKAALAETAAAKREYSKYNSLKEKQNWAESLESLDKASEHLMKAYALTRTSSPKEFRAVWCHSPYGVAGMSWDQAIRILKENGFNAVVPNMLWGGRADYISDVLPVNPNIATRGDQIELCLKAARKHGVKVHVWKVHWNLSNASDEFVERMRAQKRLQKTSAGGEEPWLCPSHPENQKLELDSMLEVVRKYAVDGIHFDYIRYPDSANCFCEGCRERFGNQTGIKTDNWPGDVVKGGKYYQQYQDFRRGNIDQLVKAVSEGARKVRPGVQISAAVFSNWPACRDEVAQDWAMWVREGYLDFVCPMNYTASRSTFESNVRVQKEAVGGKIPLYPGIGASAPGLTPIQVIDQINITREQKTNGFIIFEYNQKTAAELIKMLGMGVTKP